MTGPSNYWIYRQCRFQAIPVLPYLLALLLLTLLQQQKIGEASNAYTFVLPDNNQLSTVSDVGMNGGSVAFIYRQNINQCGGTDNGLYRYSVSTDGGNSWNVGAATSAGGCYGLGPINPLYTQASRYPNIAMFLPTGAAPDTTNLMMVYTGPVLTAAGSGWDR